jgi:hypothetical protein
VHILLLFGLFGCVNHLDSQLNLIPYQGIKRVTLVSIVAIICYSLFKMGEDAYMKVFEKADRVT